MIGISGNSISFRCVNIPRDIPDKRIVELLDISGETMLPVGALCHNLTANIPPSMHEHIPHYAIIVQSLVASSKLDIVDLADYYFYYADPAMGLYIFTER